MSSNKEESLGALEKEAVKRKERLKALKRKAENSSSTDASDTANLKYFSTKL